jgi:tetratricopeptide (TPR) repeat protein
MRQTAGALTVLVLLCHPCPSWSQGSTATLIAICDQAAASALDQSQPTGVTGVALEKIDPKIAIPACDAAAKAAPKDPRVAFQLGRAYLVAKAYESARGHFKFAADQGNAGGQNGLGALYANGRGGPTKDDGEAARLYKLAADQGDPFAQARLCSANAGVLPEQKLESCTAVIKAGRETPQNLAIAFNNRGNVYLNLKDYDSAIADFDEAIRLNPKYAFAFNNRGIAHQRKGRYDRAIQDFDRAIEIIPTYAFAFFGRGLAYQDKARWDFDSYLNEGRYEDLAMRDYDETIRLNPKNAGAFNSRGNVYMSKRMYDRAIQDYDEALRLNPNNALYLKNRGNAFRIIGQYRSAIADYRKALSLKIDERTKKQIETALKELGVAS